MGGVVEQPDLLSYLASNTELLRAIELLGPGGRSDTRKAKKLQEVAGFCETILRYVRQFLACKDELRVVEFSCGKSYVGIVLAWLLRELEGKRVFLVGVDSNARLVQKCERLACQAGVEEASFVAAASRRFEHGGPFDIALALHACDTATDEAIAKAIELGVRLVMVVPCCQNQIRGQIRTGHALTAMTEFGPVRYALANLLTDALRAQFLRSAGYYVEMVEIASPRLTPKNLCICARKSKRGGGQGRSEGYRTLRSFFGVRPKLEVLCPGVVPPE
jgi:hypothetical protein